MLHFKIEEFKCQCCGEVKMNEKFLEMIDDARRLAEVPFVISSGYRCEKHNKAVGSTSDNHTKGVAADIRCVSGQWRYSMVFSLIEVGFRRIGIGKEFIHADTNDMVSSIWLYGD